MKKLLIKLILPFYMLYILCKGKNPKYDEISTYLHYYKLVWDCQYSKLQMKFGLCKTYTFDELIKVLK